MRTLAAAIAVVIALGAPGIAGAASFEDSFVDCSYPKTFDLMIMRPFGLVAMAVGTALFIPYGPIAVLTAGTDVQEPWNTFVVRPATFTFGRGLGECPAGATDL